MVKLEDLQRGAVVKGILPDSLVTIIDISWHGSSAITLTYKDSFGKVSQEVVLREKEIELSVVEHGRPWSFDADGYALKLASEAYRIRLAYLFDPLLAVHTSLVQPLPHQITAVYESMLPRQPLRFLLADDPGAGKTIMAGLLIKELVARGDLQRCLIVCPGNLVEQWQDELYHKFNLPFEILTNDKLESARTGNWFLENSLVICRLDKLSRNEDIQEKLRVTDWDLVVCDEAHKMSASYWGGEVKYTKRYKLGKLLSEVTRNFLLMTATPHNGKDIDFQLFLGLLDGDRFEGVFREGVHSIDPSDMMRRLVKEQLVKFDGKPLFPERRAYTVNYELSPLEAQLYTDVTEYVRNEFNRADALENDGRRGTVGFALTILQRRLASSPAAIYESLKRRRERLENRLNEAKLAARGQSLEQVSLKEDVKLSVEDLEDLEDAPDFEVEQQEELVLDQATASKTIPELEAEIRSLKDLENTANQVVRSGTDRKWDELSKLLQENSSMYDSHGARRKLIIFTEHKDTLNYLVNRVSTLFGEGDSIVTIHGGSAREERKNSENKFLNDPNVKILVATDAAGEGVNLQRAHLMINYDLPWNPNRLEQRFGRIHRIGQTEVCHLWNLVASETREGEVYQRLLEKLDNEKDALHGQVFDILGKVTFDNRTLRDLLVEAVRYGERPDVKARLDQVIDSSLDREKLEELIKENAIGHDSMDSIKVQEIKEQMERAEAKKLQPHYIEAFFKESFKMLGGSIQERESRRYQISHVPAQIRNTDRVIGKGQSVLQRYERITFEKDLIAPQGKPRAEYICPGHPLLDATIDIILQKNKDILKQGAILVDPEDCSEDLRLLVYLEHGVQDGRVNKDGHRRIISKQMLFLEGNIKSYENKANVEKFVQAGYAPFLNYRPLTDDEIIKLEPTLEEKLSQLSSPEDMAVSYAIENIVPRHFDEIKERIFVRLDKTLKAVKTRLTKEIGYWDHRSEQLRLQEESGKKKNTKLNSKKAQQRADDLATRLKKRELEIQQERQVSPLPPVVIGGALIIPKGFLQKIEGKSSEEIGLFAKETKKSEMIAMNKIFEVERSLGNVPRDVSHEKCGYDIESKDKEGNLRFIEVKGRVFGAETVTITKNEILVGLNKPDSFILAIVEIENDIAKDPVYIREPFTNEPDFEATSINYKIKELYKKSSEIK
tara:strand:- start:166517 stop:170056 length:3540 start_codon:yes stop_codon:yes gene_type:complete